MTTKGAVACGHPETAAAAAEILMDGGNAFDAVLAAFCAATVAEPVLASLGGGGFLMAYPADGKPCLYDFFVQTPKQGPRGTTGVGDIDFYPIVADFGTATQEFHIGLGAMATPGAIKGLFAVQRDLARLPIRRLIEPALRLARDGFQLRPVDGYLFQVVGPILVARDDSKAAYTRPDGSLLQGGDWARQADLANTLDALAIEGEALFYHGDLAHSLVKACREQGGLLSAEDLADYRVIRRAPLDRRYHGARILINPPPSTGGILIAFALALLNEVDLRSQGFGSRDHLAHLVRVMDATNQARIETQLHEAVVQASHAEVADRLLDPALLAAYADAIKGRPQSRRGTTHISVMDADGNLAALTTSNGEGCGYVLDGTGVMLNNMLGEEDLNPVGFHTWPSNTRLSSMMAPSLAFLPDGTVAAMGSGGSNRIRTAILQVLINLNDFAMPGNDAVDAPRLHYEDGIANLEAGFDCAPDELAKQDGLADMIKETIAWPRHNLFFGGVHLVMQSGTGAWNAVGDPRRGGAARVV